MPKISEKTWILFGIIGGVIVAIMMLQPIYALINQPAAFDKAMIKFVSDFNKNCPVYVDRETRLDNMTFTAGKTLQYNYTLINADHAYFNIQELQQRLQPTVYETVKTNPEMKSLRDQKLIFIYSYKDRNGTFLFKITVTPEIYLAPDNTLKQIHTI